MTVPGGGGEFEIAKGYVEVEVRGDAPSTKKTTDKLEDQLEAAGDRGGRKAGEAAAKSVKPGARKTGDTVADELEKGGTRGGRKAGTKAGTGAAKAVKPGAKRTGDTVADELGRGGDEGTARIKRVLSTLPSVGHSSGRRTGSSYGVAFVGTSTNAIGTGLRALPSVLGPIGMAAGASVGAGFGAGILGGAALTGAAAAPIGIAALLLKDIPEVRKTWGDLGRDIASTAREMAKPLQDEIIGAANMFRSSWDRNRPIIAEIFTDAQDSADDFARGITDFTDNLLPGFEKAVQRAEPAARGFRSMLGSFGEGLGGFFEELSYHAEDFETVLGMVGDTGETALKDIGIITGDLAAAIARNEEDFRRWGRTISAAAKDGAKEVENILDLVAAAGGDWTNGKGDSFGTALEKALMGDKFKERDGKDPWDMRNLFDAYTGRNKNTYDTRGLGQRTAYNMQSAIDPNSINNVYRAREEALRKLADAQAKMNYLESIGVTNNHEYVETSQRLGAAQVALIGSGNHLSQVIGNTALTNRDLIATFVESAARGRAIPAVLMDQVRGFDAAALSATGARVRFDEYGNAIIQIPGRKDTIVNAETLAANAALRTVLEYLASLKDKTVTVTTKYNQVYQTSGPNMGAGAPKPTGPASRSHDGGPLRVPGQGPGTPVRRRARGGDTPVLPGPANATLVGETGPEIIFPDQRGYVATALQTMRMAHGLKTGLDRMQARGAGPHPEVHHHYHNTYQITAPPSMDLVALAHKVSRVNAQRTRGGS